MIFTTDALILKSADSGDYDRLLTLLTPEQGRITAIAKGVRSPRSQLASLTQPYVYTNLEIYRKGDMNWLRSGSAIEYFAGVRNDIAKLSLAAYICDIASEVTGEGVPAVDILRLTLNTLYAIDKDIAPASQIKSVYEWRVAGYAGYLPDITCCAICRDKSPELSYLDVMNGRLICSACIKKIPPRPQGGITEDLEEERSILIPMDAGALAASRYALGALPERIFSFRLADAEAGRDFSRAAESFLLNHLERGFDSLDFYKVIANV